MASLRRRSEDLLSHLTGSAGGNRAAGRGQDSGGGGGDPSEPPPGSPATVAAANAPPAIAATRQSTSRLSLSRGSILSRDKDRDPAAPSESAIPSINVRAGTELSLAQRLMGTTDRRSDPPPPPDKTRPSDLSKRGVSFLSRLRPGGRKRRDDDEQQQHQQQHHRQNQQQDQEHQQPALHDDDASNISEYGTATSATTTGVGRSLAIIVPPDAAGFVPVRKEPPRYIKIRTLHTRRDHHPHHPLRFGNLFLAQELCRAKPMPTTAPITTAAKRVVHSDDSIWAAEFSQDGRFLAVAGQDRVVRLFGLLSTPEERRRCGLEARAGVAAAAATVRATVEPGHGENADGGGAKVLSAPVFESKPRREYRGHTQSVHDLCWSKNNFLLSASVDRTVRLWHPSVPSCIHVFEHGDSVTSLAFHPTDDRFFLAGSQDGVLRLWSIPDREAAFQARESDVITAVAFAPDGRTCMAGLISGDCVFYATDGLRRQTAIQVARSSRGRAGRCGNKITSIQAMAMPSPADLPGTKSEMAVKVLISSNDSRIRIYNLADRSLELKLRGHENSCSNVKARFSDDGAYVISGSEDRRTFIWSTDPADGGANRDRERQPCESFVAHSGAVTAAIVAPTAARLLLSRSDDPIYDLCNPPPVTLVSGADFHNGSLDDMHSVDTPTTEKSPAYLARSTHLDGHIFVTSDRTGQIRVFRQDCANSRRHALRESALGGGGHSRAASVRSSSRGPLSRQPSLTRPQQRQAVTPITPQQSSDRIISWRQDVEGGGGGSGADSRIGRSRPTSLISAAAATTTPVRSERSLSPRRAVAFSPASEARRQPYYHHSPTVTSGGAAGAAATTTTTTPSGEDCDSPWKKSPDQLPTPSFSYQFVNGTHQGSASASSTPFWGGLTRWSGILGVGGSTAPNSPRPDGEVT